MDKLILLGALVLLIVTIISPSIARTDNEWRMSFGKDRDDCGYYPEYRTYHFTNTDSGNKPLLETQNSPWVILRTDTF